MSTPAKDSRSPLLTIQSQLLRECTEMTEYCLSTGRGVPPSVLQSIQAAAVSAEPRPEDTSPRVLDAEELKGLAAAHNQLLRLVAPATPQALNLLSRGSQSRLSFLGPFPFIQRMMLAAIVCSFLFILFSLSEWVNDAGNGDILHSSGLPLLLNEAFFMAAAGMGASFAALFTASRYIADRCFEPRFEVTYWISFFLGLIAGLILVTLLPVDADDGNGFARPTMAMLGGFSASAVYRILTRMVDTVESLVRGDNKELLARKEGAAKALATEEISQNRMKLVAGLVSLQQQLAGASPEQMQRQLDGFVSSLVSGLESGEPWSPAQKPPNAGAPPQPPPPPPPAQDEAPAAS